MTTWHGISTDLAEKAGLPCDRFPCTAEEIERAETAIAQALGELSIEEHERIIFDIHGFETASEVDDKVIQSSMKSLEQEIENIPCKEAYQLAMVHGKEYVMDHDFRMMFLRACDFDAIRAATMIVQHFEKKRELFGDEVLGREIRQSDLSPTDLAFVRDGRCQLVPSRDAAGRYIVVYNTGVAVNEYRRFLQRPIFYMYMAILREKDILKAGAIWIGYGYNMQGFDLDTFKVIHEMESLLPLRSAGGHLCGYHDSSVRATVAGMKLLSCCDRYRMQAHFGSLEENNFKLQTYGIPTKDCPMKADGTWSTEFHLEWLENLRLEEEKQKQNVPSSTDLIVVPRKYDVLCGKSQRAKSSCGTQRALHLVDMHRDTYESKSKHEKTAVATKILSLIHESGGRFLKESKERGRWEEMDDLSARQKIAHWFRHLRFKENLTNKGCDVSDSSDKSTRRKSWEDVAAGHSSMTSISDHEDGGPTKRLAPSLELDEELCDELISRVSIFGDDNGAAYGTHEDALENLSPCGQYAE